MHDVIIIGGSYAGLAAALQLGRARRRVLVLDGGQRRNRFANASHGFLGQDGRSAEAIAMSGRADVLAYPTVAWRDAVVTELRSIPGAFAARAGNEEHHAQRLILATGVVDELPSVAGLSERWGKTVFHCPYCHGYELEMGRIGVLATSPLSVHQAILVSEWAAIGETTLFLDGVFDPGADELAELASRRIRVERERVVLAAGEAPWVELRLADGRTTELDGLFVLPRAFAQDRFAEQLGCELEMGPLGAFYKTDAMKETSVSGVFACGDVALPAPSVALAVADGTRAGIGAHQSLVFRQKPKHPVAHAATAVIA